jgi:hypothetical protein
VVGVRHADAEEHVNYSEDDGQLHLERVQENNLVLGDLSKGIKVGSGSSKAPKSD